MVETVKIDIEAALAEYSVDSAGTTYRLMSLKLKDTDAFCRAGARALAIAETSEGHQHLARMVIGSPVVLEMLSASNVFDLEAATHLVCKLYQTEPHFDVRWMRYVCQDQAGGGIPEAVAMRVLQVLGAVSDCMRLTPLLVQLMRHGSARVRSKSVLLLGRGSVNVSRSRQLLGREDTRVRANVVESLWDQPMPGVQEILMGCARDLNRRVAVNALVGLCRFGDAAAPERLMKLADSKDPPTRVAAAWAMGHGNHPKIGSETQAKFAETLARLAGDKDSRVQKMAAKSREQLLPVAEVPRSEA